MKNFQTNMHADTTLVNFDDGAQQQGRADGAMKKTSAHESLAEFLREFKTPDDVHNALLDLASAVGQHLATRADRDIALARFVAALFISRDDFRDHPMIVQA